MKRILLFIYISVSITNAQPMPYCNDYVTLEGKQFMCGGQPFYPMSCNYSTQILFNPPANWPWTTYPVPLPADINEVYLSPNLDYGPVVYIGNYEVKFDCNNQVDCELQITEDLTKIHSMGFNTIRTHFPGAWHDIEYPFYDPTNQTTTKIHYCNSPGDLGQFCLLNANGFWQGACFEFGIPGSTQPSPELQRLFYFYGRILTIAAQCSLKVLLDVGYNNVTDDDIIGSYIKYLIYLNQYIDGLPANAQNALLAYLIVEEPSHTGLAEPTLTKNDVCIKINSIYDALHNQPNFHRLIAIGGNDIADLMLWDPGILKIDFWCPHIYPKPESEFETVNNDLAVERLNSQLYWLKNNCPYPWHIGEVSFSAIDDELINNGTAATQTYPEVNGDLQQQKQFAIDLLKNVRDCGGSGLTWWTYQESGGGTGQSFYNGMGLLRHEDYLTNAGGNLYLDKPVDDAFENYLTATNNWNAPPIDPNGCPQPTHYYDPYDHQTFATNTYSQSHIVQGDVYDDFGFGVKDAFIMSFTWTEYVTPTPEIPDGNRYHYYTTFTDASGHFELIPYNTKDPSDNTQYVNYMKIGAVGKKVIEPVPWPPPPDDPGFPLIMNGTNLSTYISSNLNTNYINYDYVIDGYQVEPDLHFNQQNDYQAVNSLTVNNFDITGGI